MNCCTEKMTSTGLSLDQLAAIQAAGLKTPDILVAWAFVEVVELDVSDTSVRLSAWEVATRTKLSIQAVKRALSKLFRMGLLIRRQDIKAAGDVAWTQVSRKACNLFGVAGGADLAGLPDDLRLGLASESAAVCEAVARAWRACGALPTTVDASWRGGASRLDAVRARLYAREQHALEEARAAQISREEAEAAERAGEVTVSCPGGVAVTVNARVLDDGAPCPFDLGFARDVLHELAVRKPDLVTPSSVPRLLAEILYSRAVGFLAGREYTPAMRILVSCLSGAKQAWGRPRGIRDQWYAAAAGACRVSTASSISVH